MIKVVLIAAASLGLSESIEPRLPEDPGMIYTAGFPHQGQKVGIDFRDGQVVAHRTCRKASPTDRPRCQIAALDWLTAECGFYEDKRRLNKAQRSMRSAVCQGAKDLDEMLTARGVAKR